MKTIGHDTNYYVVSDISFSNQVSPEIYTMFLSQKHPY